MINSGIKYIDEFRDKEIVRKLAGQILRSANRDYVFMEVCGGHTSAIHRFGITSLLPSCVKLISGPGCPVCVTGSDFIDKSIEYAKTPDFIVTTFGDLIRVPGSVSSLEKVKSEGADIRIIFSGLEALELARSNPEKKIIFLGIGFETTAPGTAVTIKEAKGSGVKNFLLLSAHKIMPPVMEALTTDGVSLDGFICPGHVAAITGAKAFRSLPEQHRLGCVVAGFEPTDILQAILMLVNQVNRNSPDIEIQYTRAVTFNGNEIAQKNLSEVFDYCEADWRGFGPIPFSGMKLRKEFESLDAEKVIPVSVKKSEYNKSCICGNILRGLNTPDNCSLFGKSCIPENPVGACMVSGEGTCNVFYKYRKWTTA